MVFGLSRLTPRRVIIFTSASVLFWLFVFSLTPITSPLPPYTGPHEVGILDVETEVQKRVIHDAILKETGENAFELSTLAITLYYPSSLPLASPSRRPWARPWLPQPISLIGTGYARLAGISFAPLQSLFTFGLWLLGSSTVIPGVVDAPILSSAEKILGDDGAGAGGLGKVIEQEHQELKREDEVGILPCVVFTHGMAGMSQSYSHYLGSIASHGYVVAAVEHRDGSGPGTIVHYPDGKEKKVWHMKLKDLKSDPPMTDLDLKAAQLAFREAEISETIKLFAQLNAGDAPVVNLKPDSPREALPGFKGRLNLAAVTVAGHSYGATGAMQALKAAGTKAMPTNGGIALDPGKGSGPLNKDIDVPVLVMQSGEWTEKQVDFYGQGQHFDVVRRIIESVKEGWFMTLSGTAHPSCTDAPLIVPWIMKMVTGTTLNPRIALFNYIDASVKFLEYLQTREKKGVLASPVTSKAGPLGDAEKREKFEGQYDAQWEVHVIPKE
ncbi:phospholipase [Parastagonospora nodorum]|uniref:Putative phospholipase n=2 Tax=Phaeosphaeria nodorum (strain SN15 / ATCC MYA-4574 / FGSC 10173) TaxID=321614 RepID=A0A7U2F939_PHANO|nr:hypothetical protein SNOG_09326 [Parastagonospora nodorum SN15]KAH3906591.1 phospholipase [Parastagonospora nodorum]EAT83518.1 hypothetical protein SNOG_09326 [Parastagonospora nodorum SN15]KAH3925773.1 phospholipase [Parastagonospora nodorum]KAH3952838.1 phospholipase [Parastagonospora nodorum]KAH3976345.1 phospholipase [Parastagonospora nodorum]